MPNFMLMRFEIVKGLTGIGENPDNFDFSEFGLTDSFAAKTWKLNFKAKNGKTGTLVLPVPSQMLTFKADIHEGKKGDGEPLLYYSKR